MLQLYRMVDFSVVSRYIFIYKICNGKGDYMSKNMYALTNPQKSIWLTEQFYKGTSIENITGTVIVSQKVDFKALEKAINLTVKNNDNFKLKFTVKERCCYAVCR